MNTVPKQRWRPFVFSIRELLLVTVIVALGICWWLDRQRQQREIQTLLETLRREAPWLVESENADYLMNQLRQEAWAKWESQKTKP